MKLKNNRYQIKKGMVNYLTLVVLLCSAFVPVKLFSQDHHFSQYDAAPMVINPSLTGLMKSDFRVVTQFRSQWGSVGSRFVSNAIAYDMHTKDKWSFGAVAMNHGSANYFNVFSFMASSAYEIAEQSIFGGTYSLRVGLQAGLIYESLKPNALLFDNQYMEGTFDNDIPSYENLERRSMVIPDFNYGIAYTSYNQQKKMNPFLGFSIFHLTQPRQSFNRLNDSRLPRRFLLHGGVKYDIMSAMRAELKLLSQWQGQASEYMAGLNLQYDINSDIMITGGYSYRFKDAMVLMVGLSHKNILYRVNYDINTSSLATFTKRNGGLEVSIVFLPPSIKGSSFN